MYVYIQGVKHRRTSGASVVQAHPIFTWPDHWIFSPGNTFGIQRNVRRRNVSRRTKCIQGVVDQQALWFRYTQINQRKSELTNVSTTFIFNQRSIKVVSARSVLCTRNSRYRNSRDRMFVLKLKKNVFFLRVQFFFAIDFLLTLEKKKRKEIARSTTPCICMRHENHAKYLAEEPTVSGVA